MDSENAEASGKKVRFLSYGVKSDASGNIDVTATGIFITDSK